ncbi:hypothetical protein SAMN04487895_101303 [Paenibacillus sophorae]|uniref:Cell division protein FtsJ n=2 Tax=Paenibacillus sophorae TaxID=1333845 RepID=A0A1H8G0T6_9BACL|nr:cyclic-phosphate processing receiver domain-containing protein [Paenibacillus sophorae]QWU18436.1 cell division protein FtsJ [Paenibacillus sophorae]SEN36938.1 hypothetical protein SAMN04487895_101303 [Paenibacillus sophorae]
MIHVFMDDYRRVPQGFTLARTTEECLLLLRECEVGVLSLDYDMGPEDETGGYVAKTIVLEALFPREIYLHTSSAPGRKEMFELLYPARPEETAVHYGPMPEEKLREMASGAFGS